MYLDVAPLHVHCYIILPEAYRVTDLPRLEPPDRCRYRPVPGPVPVPVLGPVCGGKVPCHLIIIAWTILESRLAATLRADTD